MVLAIGVFLVGTFLKKAKEIHALIGMIVSIVLMTYIILASNGILPGPVIAWPWYALIGSLASVLVALLSMLVITSNEEVSQ